MPIELNSKQEAELEALSKGRRVSVRLAERAMIILLAADGRDNQGIGEELGITRQKAGRWRLRYAQHGMAGIEKDAPRPGRFPKYGKRIVDEVIEKTLHGTPPNATHWSRKRMAEAIGLSDSTVGRIWRQHGLKPHLIRNFKLSNDRRFVEKLEDVVGLYLSPPEHAVVFSCDEKSQIQALDRTQLSLPLRVGRCCTLTHDYKRNGTTSPRSFIKLYPKPG